MSDTRLFQAYKPWDLWTGKRVKRNRDEALFIETTVEQWDHRLKIWRDNLKTDCPSPMPQGHIMFDAENREHSEAK